MGDRRQGFNRGCGQGDGRGLSPSPRNAGVLIGRVIPGGRRPFSNICDVQVITMSNYRRTARRPVALIRLAVIRATIFIAISTPSASAATLTRFVEANGLTALSTLSLSTVQRSIECLMPW